MDIVLLILVFVLTLIMGIIYGWKLREYQAEQQLKKMLEMTERIVTEPLKNVLNVDMHTENGIFYIYDSETGKFITQVTDHDSLVTFFQKHFPDKNVAMKKSDIQLLLGVE